MSTFRGTCHCGAVEIEVTLTDGLNTARRCNCSYCIRRGAVAVSAPLDGLRVTRGADVLTLYQFGTRSARHWFCSVCGIYTHHQRRSNPNQYGVNAAVLDGVEIDKLGDIPWVEGRQHPNDRVY
ncbi:MAG: GFA family protein [Pseudomonadota bacterium]